MRTSGHSDTEEQSAEDVLARLKHPVVIISTRVGRGMHTLGEAIMDRFAERERVVHVSIEDFLPLRAVTEDLTRYRWISCNMPWLLNLVYRLPIFYYRKYLRERRRKEFDMQGLKSFLEERNPETVICISHRPAFWVSTLKMKTQARFKLWGLLGEYGKTLGWQYIFWEQMNGFFSPLPANALGYPFPEHLVFIRAELPARLEYYELRRRQGDPYTVLLVCGYWGQGPFTKVVRTLLEVEPTLRIRVVCGENGDAYRRLLKMFGGNPWVRVHAKVPTLLPFMEESSLVITKPGISTILEAQAAGRKIMLLRGMPVAEDNNARYAVSHFGAEWFSLGALKKWVRSSYNSQLNRSEQSLVR
jgi:hypothetical protein